MRILAVSDEESPALYSAKLDDPERPIDLLLGCGDLAYSYMDYLFTRVHTPYALFVHGNHDHPVLLDSGKIMKEPLGWEDVDMRAPLIKEHQVIVAGMEGCAAYHPDTNYQYTEATMRLRAQRLVLKLLYNKVRHGRFMDIFITHAPMRGIHDAKDTAHRGFAIFRALVERYRPKLFLHGHTHRIALEQWYTRIGATMAINVHPFQFINISNQGILIERLSSIGKPISLG